MVSRGPIQLMAGQGTPVGQARSVPAGSALMEGMRNPAMQDAMLGVGAALMQPGGFSNIGQGLGQAAGSVLARRQREQIEKRRREELAKRLRKSRGAQQGRMPTQQRTPTAGGLY